MALCVLVEQGRLTVGTCIALGVGGLVQVSWPHRTWPWWGNGGPFLSIRCLSACAVACAAMAGFLDFVGPMGAALNPKNDVSTDSGQLQLQVIP
jgi:hypothetical protein